MSHGTVLESAIEFGLILALNLDFITKKQSVTTFSKIFIKVSWDSLESRLRFRSDRKSMPLTGGLSYYFSG